MFPYRLRETGPIETARPNDTLPWLAAMDGEKGLQERYQSMQGKEPSLPQT